MAAITSAMDDVYYEKRNFNYDLRDHRHPLWITEKHWIYHLIKDKNDKLVCARNKEGRLLCSARSLADMCIYNLVCDTRIIQKMRGLLLPTSIYPIMLKEAIYQREAHAVEWLISTWPMRTLRIYDIIPDEDYLEHEYLTVPLEGHEAGCLVDCIILGLLKLKPESRLRYLDFSRFEKDRKLCRELCRLPILWMKPSERTVENIHDLMQANIDVSKDKVQRFINRISTVYCNLDSEFKHGKKFGPITILLDLKVSLDDVPLGISLQHHTPFRFCCQRLWLKHVPEVTLPPANISRLLETTRITHLEFEDQMLPQDPTKFQSLLEAIRHCKNLTALSIPNSIDVNSQLSMVKELNSVLHDLRHLQRLNFAYCNLKGQLEQLIGGLKQRIAYLNLRDCRLTEDDISYLSSWRYLRSLRELNLSCNNLTNQKLMVKRLLEQMPNLTCFSVAHCSLDYSALIMITCTLTEYGKIKVLAMQGYTPLPRNDTLDLLRVCAQMSRLQKVILFPEVYAFPGNNDDERQVRKVHMIRASYRYLEMRARPDIELE